MNNGPTKILLIQDNGNHSQSIGDRFFLESLLPSYNIETLSIRQDPLPEDSLHLYPLNLNLDSDLNPADLILLDLFRPDQTGLDIVMQICHEVPMTPLIVLSQSSDEVWEREVIKLGAQDHLEKAEITQKSLIRAINYAFERKHTTASTRDNRYLELESKIAELEKANANLRNMAQFRDQFLNNIGHDFKTPLTSILLVVQLLQLNEFGSLNEAQLKRIKEIETSSKHLQQIIHNLLDISALQLKTLVLNYSTVNLKRTCLTAYNIANEIANSRCCSLIYEIEESLTTIEADKQRLTQILINLLSHTIKAPRTKSEVGLKIWEHPFLPFICFTVWDNGPLMEADEIAKFIETVTQIDSSRVYRYDNTGIGLVLATQFVQSHGGHIEISSTSQNMGTSLNVMIPFERALLPTTPDEVFIVAPHGDKLLTPIG